MDFINRVAYVICKILKKVNKYISIFLNDLGNKIKYGFKAPIYAERIWIDPKMCLEAISMDAKVARKESGRVILDFPPENAKIISIFEIEKIGSSFEHFFEDIPWEYTTMFRKNLKKYEGIKTFAKYKTGYYDKIYKEVMNDGRLKTRKELNSTNFREEGGILIHIGPNGKLFHGNAGNRRFSIALILGLDKIPAMVGYVHITGINHLSDLRKH